jgi:hypothetical protein
MFRRRGRSRPPDADLVLEDIEIDPHFPFAIMDPALPLMVDSCTRSTQSSFFLCIAVELAILLIVTIFAPKSHFAEYALFVANNSQIYSFTFTELAPDTELLSLSLCSLRSWPFASSSDILSISTSFVAISGQRRTTGLTKPRDVSLQYFSLRSNSHPLDVFSISPSGSHTIILNTMISVTNSSIRALLFEFSTSNSANSVVRRISFCCFVVLPIFLSLFLLFTRQNRIEQMATFGAFFLFLMSCFTLIKRSFFFLICEKVFVCYLRVALFYIVAFIANKHKNVITETGFVLIAVAFLFDLVCSWNGSLDILHGHDIVLHLVLVAAIGSMVAAMYFFADDVFAFVMYSALLGLNFLATICLNDLWILIPHLAHWIEPTIAFTGIHGIIMTLLFFLHQGVAVNNEVNKLSDVQAGMSLF